MNTVILQDRDDNYILGAFQTEKNSKEIHDQILSLRYEWIDADYDMSLTEYIQKKLEKEGVSVVWKTPVIVKI